MLVQGVTGPGGAITVVSGLPRSGTSLMMQMLAAGGMPVLTDGVRRPDEDNPRGYFEYEPVKHTWADASWVPAAVGRAVKVVHLLLPSLPPGFRYRVLLLDRDLAEVTASQQAMLARKGQSLPLPESRLAAVYAEQLADVRRRLAERSDVAVLEMRHVELVGRPAAAAAAVNAFLGGGLDETAMAACVVPSLHRNRVRR